MSGYGSKVNSEGKSITADGFSPIMVGERVVGNKIKGVEFAKNEDTSINEDRAFIIIEQTNGAEYRHMLTNSDNVKAQDIANRTVLHLATKFMTEEEYYAALANPSSFKEFVTALKDRVFPRAVGKTFTMKFTYRQNGDKFYAGFPTFPNFVELDGTTPSGLSTNPKFDIYETPTRSNVAPPTEATSEDDVF